MSICVCVYGGDREESFPEQMEEHRSVRLVGFRKRLALLECGNQLEG